MIERLIKFQQEMKGKYSSYGEILSLFKDPKFSSDFRALYEGVMRKPLSGCINCKADAFIELMAIKPKERKSVMESKFKLKAGVLLYDFNDSSNNATNANLTDELALKHLSKDKNKIKFFEKYPENWQELIEEQKPKRTKK